MEISSNFRDVIIVLIAAVDRAFGSRDGMDVIEAVDEPLARAKVETVLKLRRNLSGLVDDAGLVEDIGAVGTRLDLLEQVCLSRIARIHEYLAKESTDTSTQLI